MKTGAKCLANRQDAGGGPNPALPIDARALPTSPQEANAQALERLYRDMQKGSPDPLQGWLSARRLNRVLAQCEEAGVSLPEVANRKTLLPRAAIVCLRLLQWISDAATRIQQTIIARFPRYQAAARIAWEISGEHARALPLRRAMYKAERGSLAGSIHP